MFSVIWECVRLHLTQLPSDHASINDAGGCMDELSHLIVEVLWCQYQSDVKVFTLFCNIAIHAQLFSNQFTLIIDDESPIVFFFLGGGQSECALYYILNSLQMQFKMYTHTCII